MPDSLMPQHLVGRSPSAAELRAALGAATHCATSHLHADHPPCQPPDSSAPAIAAVDMQQPLGSFEECLGELERLWLDKAVYYHHPRYLSHLNCPVATPAVAAEVVASSLNTAVESWDQAGPAAHIEQRLIAWAAELIGFDTDGDDPSQGVFTSGGTQSNLQALTVARNSALHRLRTAHPELSHGGALDRLRILASPAAHYSIARGAELLGLDPSAVIDIDVDHTGAMRVDALASTLTALRAEGAWPAAVVCTAGTTDRGSIDPISEVAEVTRPHGVHLHVDAAYGGAGLLAPHTASRLYGIEKADSVTLDFHKGFYQPVACSCVVFSSARHLRHIRWNADYLNPAGSSRANLADLSLQTTRRFDALKLWVTLRTLGPQAIGEAFDTCCALARQTAQLIDSEPRLELFEIPHLSTVLFALAAPETPPAAAPEGFGAYELIRDELFDSGTAAVAITKVDGRALFKFTILDPTLSAAELQAAVTAVADCALRHLARVSQP